MDYHVARNNQPLGVYPEADLRARLQSGEIQPSDLVWCEGMPAWKPAAEVFAPAVPPAVPAGVPPAPAPAGAKPNNYLIPAILVTLFCCLPFGIVSIIFATQVDSKYAGGDYAGAASAAGKAKLWMWIGLGSGLVFGLGYIGLMAVGLAAGGLPH